MRRRAFARSALIAALLLTLGACSDRTLPARRIALSDCRLPKVAQAVQAGYVWVNGVGQHYRGVPYGGFKNSGIGREEGISELLSYTEEKVINIVLGGAEYNPAAG